MGELEPKYKVGRKVYMDGLTSMAQYGGILEITEIDHRFNEMTGKKYFIYKIGSYWWDEDGGCYSNPNLMYEIDYSFPEWSENCEEDDKGLDEFL